MRKFVFSRIFQSNYRYFGGAGHIYLTGSMYINKHKNKTTVFIITNALKMKHELNTFDGVKKKKKTRIMGVLKKS